MFCSGSSGQVFSRESFQKMSASKWTSVALLVTGVIGFTLIALAVYAKYDSSFAHTLNVIGHEGKLFAPGAILAFIGGGGLVRLVKNHCVHRKAIPSVDKKKLPYNEMELKKEFSELGMGTIEKGREILRREYPQLEKSWFKEKDELNLFLKLQRKKSQELFPGNSRVDEENYRAVVWDQNDFMVKAHELMCVAYTLACLSLESLDGIVKTQPDLVARVKEIRREEYLLEAILVMQNTARWEGYYACANTYLMLLLSFREQNKHVEPFYAEENYHNTWRLLYEDFQSQRWKYVDKEKLNHMDPRFIKHVPQLDKEKLNLKIK